MRNITYIKPVIDLQKTGSRIKELRKDSGFTVRDIQDVFGFEYPQAVYAWEQGKNVPTIDNLLVLANLFAVSIEEIVVTRNVEVEIQCSSEKIESLCTKKCETCKYKKSA